MNVQQTIYCTNDFQNKLSQVSYLRTICVSRGEKAFIAIDETTAQQKANLVNESETGSCMEKKYKLLETKLFFFIINVLKTLFQEY